MFPNNKTITKKDISNEIHKKIGLSFNYSKLINNDVIEIISFILKTEKNIVLKNLGTLTVKVKKERLGRNPKTKKEYLISARNSVLFKPSENIKKKLIR
jgi:integration host factor subunit alpha